MTATTTETAAFLRRQHTGGSRAWQGKCLMLQRMARGLPALFPSALAAAHGTPESERVYHVADLRRGMVAFSDDPHDSNPFGHIYFIAGWKGSDHSNPDDLMVWSNDVRVSGGVDMVAITYFRAHWGDGFQFGATWLNGFNFTEFDKPPVLTHPTLGAAYQHAISDVEKAIEFHKKKGDDKLVVALQRDLTRMKKRAHRFS